MRLSPCVLSSLFSLIFQETCYGAMSITLPFLLMMFLHHNSISQISIQADPSSSHLLCSLVRHHLPMPTPTPATAYDNSSLTNKTGNYLNRGCGGWQRKVQYIWSALALSCEHQGPAECCRRMNVRAAVHVVEGPVLVFVVVATETYCDICPGDLDPHAAVHDVSAFCPGISSVHVCQCMGIAQWSGLHLGHHGNPLTSKSQLLPYINSIWDSCAWPVNDSLAHHFPVWDTILVWCLTIQPPVSPRRTFSI